MKLPISLVGFALLAAASSVYAANPDEGKTLVSENCQSCHGDEIYTRPDRKVNSLDGLRKQVRRCELALGLQWFDDQIESTAVYLNGRFYRFE
jgi:mono/diheme cytochrome c family protein